MPGNIICLQTTYAGGSNILFDSTVVTEKIYISYSLVIFHYIGKKMKDQY